MCTDIDALMRALGSDYPERQVERAPMQNQHVTGEHRRTQWNVGQGGFHSGEIRSGQSTFRYVYDCGSSRLGAVEPIVDEYLTSLGDDSLIDAVFLSHVDSDHINGLRRLLSRSTVGLVFLPMLTTAGRLASMVGSGGIVTPFLADLVADPVAAIQGVSADTQVIEVRPSPGGEIVIDDLEGIPLSDAQYTVSPEIVDHVGDYLPPATGSAGRISDSSAIRIAIDGVPAWSLTFFVDKQSADREPAFRAALATELGVPQTQLDQHLTQAQVRDLLTTSAGRKRVRRAFAGASVSPNRSSLVMLTGPSTPPLRHCEVITSPASGLALSNGTWLLTGDAELFSARSVAEMTAHLGWRADQVEVLALPHHGSRWNFHEALLSPRLEMSFASAGARSRWGHPHSDVVTCAAKQGAPVWTVTESCATRIDARMNFLAS